MLFCTCCYRVFFRVIGGSTSHLLALCGFFASSNSPVDYGIYLRTITTLNTLTLLSAQSATPIQTPFVISFAPHFFAFLQHPPHATERKDPGAIRKITAGFSFSPMEAKMVPSPTLCRFDERGRRSRSCRRQHVRLPRCLLPPGAPEDANKWTTSTYRRPQLSFANCDADRGHPDQERGSTQEGY